MSGASGFDATAYWEARHARFRGSAVSVGNITLSDEDNRQQLAEKTELLARCLVELFPDPTGRRLLDLGCGIGIQTRAFGELGFTAVGIDFSPTTIEEARRLGGARFHVAGLHDFAPDEPFDVCTCIDVLYHVVDQELWQRGITALAGFLKPGGYLLIVEHFPDTPSRSPHIVWRSLADYDEALSGAGLEIVRTEEYATPRSQVRKTLLVGRKRSAHGNMQT